MIQKLLLLLICLITLQGVTLCAGKSGTECFEEGYNAAIYSYKSGVHVSPPPGCNIPQTVPYAAWWNGYSYVTEYGATKNGFYYDKLRSWRFADINQTNNTKQASAQAINEGLTNTEQPQTNVQDQQQQIQESQSPANTLINTGMQILNRFIGY